MLFSVFLLLAVIHYRLCLLYIYIKKVIWLPFWMLWVNNQGILFVFIRVFYDLVFAVEVEFILYSFGIGERKQHAVDVFFCELYQELCSLCGLFSFHTVILFALVVRHSPCLSIMYFEFSLLYTWLKCVNIMYHILEGKICWHLNPCFIPSNWSCRN